MRTGENNMNTTVDNKINSEKTMTTKDFSSIFGSAQLVPVYADSHLNYTKEGELIVSYLGKDAYKALTLRGDKWFFDRILIHSIEGSPKT